MSEGSERIPLYQNDCVQSAIVYLTANATCNIIRVLILDLVFPHPRKMTQSEESSHDLQNGNMHQHLTSEWWGSFSYDNFDNTISVRC